MEDGLERLKRKYAEIAEFTRPKCLGECPEPGACCRRPYCLLAGARAAEFGMNPATQAHAELPFMGADGCVLPPYLRPLCAVHVCEVHLLGESSYAKAYFAMREEVCALEETFGPSWPDGLARNYWD